MTSEEKLRKYIRKEINNILSEISTTGNIAGYLTPLAFSGDKKSNADRVNRMASMIGYKLTKKGNEDVRSGDKLNEVSDVDIPSLKGAFQSTTNINPTGVDAFDTPVMEKEFATRMAKLVGYTVLLENYYEYKRDDSKRPHQKIGTAIDEVSRQLKLIEKVLKMNHRLKRDSKLQNKHLWKRTQNQLLKIENRLLNLASRLREMRS
jgi:hypothetical protein